MSQWGLLSWEPDLDIWGKANSCVKVSVSGRTSILFHKARATVMIWKQRAKLVMATARWGTQASHLWHCDTNGWEFTQIDPTFPNYVLSLVR